MIKYFCAIEITTATLYENIYTLLYLLYTSKVLLQATQQNFASPLCIMNHDQIKNKAQTTLPS